jgi:hypothetical protein
VWAGKNGHFGETSFLEEGKEERREDVEELLGKRRKQTKKKTKQENKIWLCCKEIWQNRSTFPNLS